MNLYLFRKYWRKHKGRLFSLILSIILLTATTVFSILNERSELRNNLHKMYNAEGNYGSVLHNISVDDKDKIFSLPSFERIGIISVIGTVSVGESNYTIGSFEDEIASEDYHLPLVEGKLPEKTGEIAVPEFILNQLYANIEIGDEVSFEFTDLNGKKQQMSFKLSGVISSDINRMDMEYHGLNYGSTIINDEISYPNPSIYINKNDSEKLQKYYNYLMSPNEKNMFYDGTQEIDLSLSEALNYADGISSGSMYFNLIRMSDNIGNNTQGLTGSETDNIKVINIITFFMTIIASIAMFSGVISIMPKRIESLRLLRSIGMSKHRLFGMFITEFFLLWMIGNVLGIALGCGVHEIVILFRKLVGIPAYRGYIVEFIVGEITVSPFILPLILSIIIAAVSLIIPIYKIITMTFYKKTSVRRSKKKIKSLNKAFSKITGTGLLTSLSCFSIVMVIIISVFGYCYYTNIGKGKTYFTIGNKNASENYYKIQGINMKKNNLDCTVTANIPMGNSIAVYDKEYGITAEKISELSETAEVYAWSIYPAYSVIYGENDKLPLKLGQNIVPFNEEWEHYNDFKNNTIYDVQFILINDSMMKLLGDYSEDDVVLMCQTANYTFDIDEIIPMFSCLCDENTHALLDTSKKIDVKITQQYDLSQMNEESNDILKNCRAFKFSSPCAIVMTAEKAEKLGFYHAEYSSAFMDFKSELTDEEMRQTVSKIMNKPVQITTIYELKHNAIMHTLSENTNVFVLFILLFILCIVSIINLIHMNVQNNLETFSTLHAIGLPIKRIRKLFIFKVMKNILIAIIVGIAVSLVGKGILIMKYNEYMNLLEKQQLISGNTAFPNMIYSFTLSEIDKSNTELYSLTERVNNLKDTFILYKEMWSPNLFIPLFIICGIILISTLICSLVSAKKIKDERSLSDD